MKKFLYWILAGLLAVGTFLFGFLIRQPKINKLKKQVETLQKDNSSLLYLYQRNQDEFQDLLMQHKALKAWNFSKKAALKEGLRENLILQYALKDYIELLLKYVKQKQDLEKNEIIFFTAYEKVIDGKKISTNDKVRIREYIENRHSEEINALTECDCSVIFQELEDFKQ